MNRPTEWSDVVENGDDNFGLWEAECRACNIFARVDDTGLCEECAGKLERDFIRRREWAYSALAFGCPKDKLEALRDEVVRDYGKSLELLADEGKPSKRKKKGRRGGGNR